MFGSAILDVAIGMALVYLLLSLVASSVQETIAAVLQSRSANLLQGLNSLFSGDEAPDGRKLLSALYDHGLIRGLYRDPNKDSGEIDAAIRIVDKFRMFLQRMLRFAPPEIRLDIIKNRMLLPAYIPSRTFALALIDILRPAGGEQTDINTLRSKLVAATTADATNKALQALSALAASSQSLTEFQGRVENWYNDAMDRVSGWYKKYTQKILLIIGLVLAIAFNVNSILVAKTLWTDKDAREAMVDAAKQYLAKKPEIAPPAAPAPDAKAPDAQTPDAKAPDAKVPDTKAPDTKPQDATTPPASPTVQDEWSKLNESIGKFKAIEDQKLLPVGWNDGLYPDDDPRKITFRKAIYALIGWFITALALSLGASFWFDTLNKFMVIRGTIKPDEKSQPEPSKG
jgi:hypothetical protein